MLFSPPCPLPRGFSPLLRAVAAQASQLSSQVDAAGGFGGQRGEPVGVYHHPAAAAFILLVRAPPGSQGSAAPSQSCSVHLPPPPAADPSETARGAQSNPPAKNRALAPVGWGRVWGGCPSWLSTHSWRWDPPGTPGTIRGFLLPPGLFSPNFLGASFCPPETCRKLTHHPPFSLYCADSKGRTIQKRSPLTAGKERIKSQPSDSSLPRFGARSRPTSTQRRVRRHRGVPEGTCKSCCVQTTLFILFFF